MADILWIEYEESPIKVIEYDGKAHRLELEVSDHVIAIETFPETKNTGKYALKLQREISQESQIIPQKEKLIGILREFGLVWTFSGGSVMTLQDKTVCYTPRYESNAESLSKIMLDRKGLKRERVEILGVAHIIGTFHRFPLLMANDIRNSMKDDFYLRMMLEYFNEARLDENMWFVHLHKIWDTLKYSANKDKQKENLYGIDKNENKRFRKLLNTGYDLRHARKEGENEGEISKEEKCSVFGIANNMIFKYMDFHKIPHY